MSFSSSFLLGTVAVFLTVIPAAALAQENKCDFGTFEVGIPGLNNKGESICKYISTDTPITSFMAKVINFVTAFVIMAAIISVVVAGFFYMTAQGDGKQVGFAKEILKDSMIAIVIALTAWLLLNTISPQFAGKLQEPVLNFIR